MSALPHRCVQTGAHHPTQEYWPSGEAAGSQAVADRHGCCVAATS